jgi:hypothetical protein
MFVVSGSPSPGADRVLSLEPERLILIPGSIYIQPVTLNEIYTLGTISSQRKNSSLPAR